MMIAILQKSFLSHLSHGFFLLYIKVIKEHNAVFIFYSKFLNLSSACGNVHIHLAVFVGIDNIPAYVYKHAKNNQRRKVEAGYCLFTTSPIEVRALLKLNFHRFSLP